MPRKSAKKQTRLAFAPTVASPSRDGGDDNSDRFARLSYGHPSMASVRTDVSQKSKASGSKRKISSRSKVKTPDLLGESPVEQTSQGGARLAHCYFTFMSLICILCFKPKLQHKIKRNHQMTTSLFPVLRENDEQFPILAQSP